MALYTAGDVTGWVKIGSTTISSNADPVEIEHGWDSTYDVYKLYVSNLRGTSDGQSVKLQLKSAGSYDEGDNYHYQHSRYSGSGISSSGAIDTDFIVLHQNQGVDGAGESTNLEFTFHNPDDTTYTKHVSWIGSQAEQSASRGEGIIGGGGTTVGVGAITGFRFKMGSGSIASAQFTSYGLIK